MLGARAAAGTSSLIEHPTCVSFVHVDCSGYGSDFSSHKSLRSDIAGEDSQASFHPRYQQNFDLKPHPKCNGEYDSFKQPASHGPCDAQYRVPIRLLYARRVSRSTVTQCASWNLTVVVSYAYRRILSHTWGADEDEVTFNDLYSGSGKNKAGYTKIQFCGQQARKNGLQYFWVDTCCINKANLTELAEAITSMFRWYRDAAKCYVYLSDVSVYNNDHSHPPQQWPWESAFRKSRWFTRGWTLQELLAPKSVEFFSREGERLGDRNLLEQVIHEITDIPISALRGTPMSHFSDDEKIRWAAKRHTKKIEDKAYCLLGIFGVFMSLRYGEGDNAFSRLEKKINRSARYELTEPVWYIPFDPMSGFVGRKDELKHVKQKIFKTSGRRIVSVLGLGGVGKSRLVLELAYQIRSDYPQYSIFWIQAAGQLTFEKDMLEIGKRLRIPGIEDEKADVKTLVKQRLSNPSEGKWILILDNADDESLWGKHSDMSQQTVSLANYLPRTANGAILVTTRTRQVASGLAGKEVIELKAMTEDEAVEMFTERLEATTLAADRAILLTLANKLACLPLAIVQAASFTNMTQQPVQTYLELLDEPEIDVIKLLSEDFGDPSRYPEAKNPIATTWFISFEYIRQHHPLAARFLSCMACFHETNIPASLLPEASSKMDIVKAISVLTGYSFITKRTASGDIKHLKELYDMHRLVQLAARNWLKMEGSFPTWIKACITRTAQIFPTREYRNKGTWTAYLPHAQRLCEGRDVEDLPERYELLEKMGLCFVIDGKYGDAVRSHSAVVQWRQYTFGASELPTLRAYSYLGEALIWKGNWSAAEWYLQQALNGQRETLGQEHPSTLTSMANLASTFRNQGRWKEAEELLVQVMETSSRVLGTEHLSTLTSVANLALTFRNQGRWKEAEELQVRVMKTSSRVLGTEHISTLTSMGNLASTFRNQGRWKEAEELDVHVVETSSRVLGTEHPDALISMGNLASTFRNQGRWKEAEELDVQVMETRSRVLGAEHPSTLTSMGNLASTFRGQSRLKEAEELDVQVMETRSRVLGGEHPDTLTSMNNLAFTIQTHGRNVEAMKLMEKCVQLRIQVLGAHHPYTLSSAAALAKWKGVN
ncbi:uncharacterized protein Z518_08853 [Rhinocladiella mackenziei CBS 650.93]|uniref:HET-domain-containing protein n=1 Tax=Rhinocladiella mackenziei CBS 650.93 TaxID=1442369 RepID=A0A0D2J1Y7_9EURO|nr:uncharacterized protein Z518_08853 [Rhinocladiella mackenziei CBS 650.93]KIX02910.1 hypothetical protein Z518_08853 [Rhinocladiella mackenziei CBS 650.93]